MNIIDKIIDIIRNNNKFIITSHVNPDGDAIGSELALARGLVKIGKSVRIINDSETPQNLKFMLENNDEIELFGEEKHKKPIEETDVIILLDLNQFSRTGSMEESLRKSNAQVMCIDHHEYGEDLSDNMWIDITNASSGELIYELLSKLQIDLDYQLALPLYVAILTDTGSFRFDRTTSEVHLIVAKLLETGIEPNLVYREIYEKGLAGRIQLLGRALSSLKICCDSKIAYMAISKSDLNLTGTNEEDVEGFVNYNLTIKGIEVGLFFFEKDDGVKVSFRSVKNIPVNKLALKFGGGGHLNAAGAKIKDKKIDQTIKEVLREAERFLRKFYEEWI